MQKILVCVPSLATGGAEKFAVDLAIQLNQKGYKVIVVQTRQNIESFLKKALLNLNIRVEDISGRSYIEMLNKQIEFFKKEKPDIVHANTGSILHIMLACLICKIPKRIYTVHNEAKLLYGKSFIKKGIYKMAFSFFKFTPVAICQTVKETLINDMKINNDRIPVVNNGVDIKRFSPNFTRCDRGEEIKIISVGTLYWIKNQEMIIRTIANIHNQQKRVSLTLLGDGENRTSIEKLIFDLNAESYIFVPGKKKDVENYLRNSDIYVSASKTEGLPLSILEAMACGLPVVATNAGGTKDIVKNNINGYVVPIDGTREFEQSIIELINNTDRRKKFSKESRKIAEDWSIENCIKGYVTLYEK